MNLKKKDLKFKLLKPFEFNLFDNSYNPFSSLLITLTTLQFELKSFRTKDEPIEPVPPVINIFLFLRKFNFISAIF